MMRDIIANQIGILYQLHILRSDKRNNDVYEELLREQMMLCKTEYDILAMLHNIKAGKETLEQFLKRKGVL